MQTAETLLKTNQSKHLSFFMNKKLQDLQMILALFYLSY
jgi:hypothetical protein